MRGEHRGAAREDAPRAAPQLFASSRDEPRARRPTDAAMLAIAALIVLFAAVVSQVGADLDSEFSALLARLPSLLGPLWRLLAWVAVVWTLVLLAAALARHRLPLARDMLFGAALALLFAVLIAAFTDADPWAPLDRLADIDGPPVFPPGLLTLTTAALAVASPHVTQPVRHLGRWLIGGALLSAIMLGAAVPSGAIVAWAAGTAAAATVHLIVGSPGGRPTADRIQLALRQLNVDADELAPAPAADGAVVRFVGRDPGGPIDVKVYGRDAWDAQLFATLWRLAWYRGAERSARLSRLELVEHEAFMTLFAERAGLRAPRLVTAGSAGQGDALIVVRPDGEAVGTCQVDVADDALDGLWDDLRRLGDVGVAHHDIDLDRVVLRADGSLGFGDLSSATMAGAHAAVQRDRAQLLAVTLALVGEERAVASARRTLGDDGLFDVLPYLQQAATPPEVRSALDTQHVDLDEVRGRVRVLLGADDQPLVKLRRVTTGSVINLALLGIATFTLIGLLGDIDLQSFADALADASWAWLFLALIIAQLARIPAAVSTMGALDRQLPLGPMTTLQFAICYVNLAIPSTAARVAINVRFFQRFGVPPTEAVSAGVIDSLGGFVIQAVIIVLALFASDLDLQPNVNTSDISGFVTLALIVIAAAVVVIVFVLVAMPGLRRRVAEVAHRAVAALRVLRSPKKLVELFGGNLLSQALFAIALGASAEAFGADLSLMTLLVINTMVSLFAGLMPVPGGIGVTEAGLTFGLTTAGVPSSIALAIALAYRFCSFYLPPIWGWFCYQWLIRRRYL